MKMDSFTGVENMMVHGFVINSRNHCLKRFATDSRLANFCQVRKQSRSIFPIIGVFVEITNFICSQFIAIFKYGLSKTELFKYITAVKQSSGIDHISRSIIDKEYGCSFNREWIAADS